MLIGTAIAVLGPGLKYRRTTGEMKSNPANPGAHGFSEILYAFSSAGNNNGSAFAGLNANEPFYNTALGLAMLFARFWLMIPVLAVAGSLATQEVHAAGAGHAADAHAAVRRDADRDGDAGRCADFVPALALGPVVEHLQMMVRMTSLARNASG